MTIVGILVLKRRVCWDQVWVAAVCAARMHMKLVYGIYAGLAG